MGGLFKPEPAGMDDQLVEMAVVQGGRREAAVPCRHGARPKALELIDAERACLRGRRE
jgi:hypothetical protein